MAVLSVLIAAGILTHFLGTETASVATNVFLTTVLIIVYREISRDQQRQTSETSRQADLQEEVVGVQQDQTEIARKQRELAVHEQRPVLQVEGYRPADPEYSRYSTSALEVKVSNIGRTPALDLELEFVTGFLDTQPLLSGRNLISVRRKEEDDNWYHEWEENLEANSNSTVYIGEPLMIVWRNSNIEDTKQRALEFMKNEDEEFEEVDTIRLKANLVYKGIGKSFREPIFDYQIKLSSYGGMRSALENGRRYNQSMSMNISNEIFEYSREP